MYKETQGMSGRLTLILRDRDGKIISQQEVDNTIVNSGRELVAKLFSGEPNSNSKPPIQCISHIAVGTGTANANPEDTRLENEVCRKPITVDITGSTVKLTAELEPEDAKDNALAEAGTFNSDKPENSIMYNRVTFKEINKTGDFKLSLIWEIKF